jgi:glycosyltransferase involved in cell wall biosynthesis
MFITWELVGGGMQRHWQQLVGSFAEKGIDSKVVCLGTEREVATEMLADGLDVVCLGTDHQSWPKKLWSLFAIARKFKPEVIVTSSDVAIGAGAVIAKLLRVRNTVNWHTPPGLTLGKRIDPAQKIAARLGADVICVSESQIPFLMEWGHRRDRIEVISNGIIEPAAAHADAKELRDQLGISQSAKLAVVVAQLRQEKRIERFVEAIAGLEDPQAEVQGIVVGEGEERAQLESLIARSGAPVRLIGYDPAAPRWIRAADAVCLTSEFEAFPLAVVEAMACSRPFVVMQTGSLDSMTEQSGGGFCVDPGDLAAFTARLQELFADPQMADAMGRSGRAYWEANMQLDDMVERYRVSLLRSS